LAEKVNELMLNGTTYREISRITGHSKSTLYRHRQHLPVPAIKAAERLKAEEVAAATTGDTDILSQARDLGTRAARLLTECENDKDRKHEIAAMREARGLLELQGRLMGAFSPDTSVQVNVGLQTITAAPEYPILMKVLDRHPEIRQELTEALQGAGL
jgi:hypothetical protein